MSAIQIGQHIKPVYGGGVRQTAGTSPDNVEQTGPSINRKASGTLAMSATVLIPWSAVIANTKTLSFTVKRQQSSDNSTWDSAETIQAATVAQTSTADGSYTGLVELDQDLSGCKQYVKYLVTADLNAANTDTAEWHCVVILGGMSEIPAV